MNLRMIINDKLSLDVDSDVRSTENHKVQSIKESILRTLDSSGKISIATEL